MSKRPHKPAHKPAHKQPGEYGLFPGGKPKSIAWRTDYDYIGKLSKAERLWLAEFSDRFYGGDFRGDTDGEWSALERRKAYRQKNAANRDMYTAMVRDDPDDYAHGDRHGQWEPAGVVSTEPTPEYLSSPEYKQHVEDMRRRIPETQRITTTRITTTRSTRRKQ